MATVDITAKSTVYPSALDVAEIQDEGRFATEQKHTAYVRNWLVNHVVSGFAFPATDPDLTITIPSGECVIDGHSIVISTGTDVLLDASSTNHIFIQTSDDVNGDVDAVKIVTNTTGIAPSNSVKLGQAITDGSTVTSTVDEDRIEDPYLFQDNNFYAATGKLAIGAGGFATLPLFSAGSAQIFVYPPISAEFINIALNAFGGLGSPVGNAEVRLLIVASNKSIVGPTEVIGHGATRVAIVSAPILDLIPFNPGRYLKISIQGGQTVTSGQGAEANDNDAAFSGASAGATLPIDGVKFFSRTDRSE